MPHLRYLRESQLQKLNSSLARLLHVYGHTTALCADMGEPPIRLTQQVQSLTDERDPKVRATC
jgi:hypothetical protein